jgi:hypothetical protein
MLSVSPHNNPNLWHQPTHCEFCLAFYLESAREWYPGMTIQELLSQAISFKNGTIMFNIDT